jgi:hypothetical protein
MNARVIRLMQALDRIAESILPFIAASRVQL